MSGAFFCRHDGKQVFRKSEHQIDLLCQPDCDWISDHHIGAQFFDNGATFQQRHAICIGCSTDLGIYECLECQKDRQTQEDSAQSMQIAWRCWKVAPLSKNWAPM